MSKGIFTMGLAALTSLAAIGQDAAAPKADETRSASVQAEPPRQLSPFNKASTLMGSAVRSVDGKAVGKVQDLVFDLDKGELSYVVVGLDAGNGKERQVAVPSRALKPADGAKHLVLNISESVLAATEGLQDGDWPGTEIFAVGGPAQAESGSARSSTGGAQSQK